jgi:hypothetical protein
MKHVCITLQTKQRSLISAIHQFIELVCKNIYKRNTCLKIFMYWSQSTYLIIHAFESECSATKSQSPLKFSNLSYSQTTPTGNEISVACDCYRKPSEAIGELYFFHALNLSRQTGNIVITFINPRCIKSANFLYLTTQ